MRVDFDPDARQELTEAGRYYARVQLRPGLARRFRHAVAGAVAEAVAHPTRCRAIRGPYRRCNVSGFPYHLVFRADPERVVIVAVAHDRRHPEFWAERARRYS